VRRLAAACWIVAGGGYLTLEAVAAAAFQPSYGYATNFISDLGRPSLSALAPVMNGAFYLQGTGFFAAAILVSRTERFSKTGLFVSLAATNAVGNYVVGTIHSGGPWPHVAGAVLAIVGGNAAVLAGSSVLRRAGAAPWYRTASVSLAALGLTAFAALAVQTVAGNEIVPNAVLERVSVYTIIAWQVLSAVQVWPTRGARTTLPS
jgi:hypothetical membrane protein